MSNSHAFTAWLISMDQNLECTKNKSILTNILWILFANVFFWPEEMLKFYFCIIPSENWRKFWYLISFISDIVILYIRCEIVLNVHFGPEPCDTNRVDQLCISWFSKAALLILCSIWFGIHFALFHQAFLWKKEFWSIDYSHTSITEIEMNLMLKLMKSS